MHATLRHSSGPAIEKPADLISLLTSLQPGDVLFIDEIHRLRTNIEEILYSAMEDWNIDIMIGSGTGASAVKMPIARFTLVGATTKLASVSNPLRDRFEHVIKLDFYDEKELSTITRRSFALLGITQVSPTACDFTARRSRGTPRIANRFVRILRDHATVGRDISRTDECEAIF